MFKESITPKELEALDYAPEVYAIEEEMGVKIPDDQANGFVTVKDAYDFIKSQQA